MHVETQGLPWGPPDVIIFNFPPLPGGHYSREKAPVSELQACLAAQECTGPGGHTLHWKSCRNLLPLQSRPPLPRGLLVALPLDSRRNSHRGRAGESIRRSRSTSFKFRLNWFCFQPHVDLRCRKYLTFYSLRSSRQEWTRITSIDFLASKY